MRLTENKLFRAAGLLVCAVFLLQALKIIQLVPVNVALDFIGQGNDIPALGLAMAVSFLFVFLAPPIYRLLTRIGFPEDFSADIVSQLFIAGILAWVTFFLASITSSLLTPFVASEVAVGVSREIFLNMFVFWFVLLRTQITPEFDKKSLKR